VFAEADSLGGLRDPEVGKTAIHLLGDELDLKLGVKVEGNPCLGGVQIRWTGPDGEGQAVFDRVLVAAGRPPNLEALNLEAAALERNDHGIPLHDRATLRCGSSAVFLAGDANHDLPVLHEASRQGSIAGRNAARLPDVEAVAPPPALSIVFTDPDIASIGQPLEALGEEAVIGRRDFDAGRAIIENRVGGTMRLYARREDGIIAGGEMVGPAVEHLAHAVAFMVQQRMTPSEALRLPFYHPTYEEDLKSCLVDLLCQLD
jgi:dihydrolipoamide dehydrogenase